MLGQKNQKIGVIVQARMDSTRLPGKVLMELNKNERVLDLLIMRLKLSKFLNEIIIATTPKKKNSLIIEAAESHNVSFFIGSEKNVLERYYKAAKQFNLDIVIRATSDNPFVDPFILDDMIEFYQENNYDCIKNVSHGSTNFPVGFDIEIFSFEVLESVYKLVEDNWDKEHVTRYIYDHPKDFTIFLYNKENLKKFGSLRLTIDEKEDLLLCQEVYKRLINKGKQFDFTIYDILEIIEKEPELMNINKFIKKIQKNAK